MIYDNANEVIEEYFESLLNRYQIWLETWIRDSDLIFNCVYLVHFKCHKIDLNRGGSYIDSFDWMKSKRATIYPVNDDDKYFQSTATVTLNNERNRKQIAKNIKN